MSAPLYKNNQMPANKDITGNKGLWFDRFYDQYDKETWDVLKPKHTDEEKGNSYWLLEYFHGKKVGNDDQLASFAAQQKSLAEDALQGCSQIFTANWHFVTGMGNPHPVENGFAWHPTLGVPYLTGAAVKGLVRNYIENNLEDTPENEKQLLLNWFGSEHKNPEKQIKENQAGNLIFFDAIPTEAVQLTVDIMTPHMGDWYQKGADNPNEAKTLPADWHDPVPITFLTCNKISLQFSFGFRQYPENKEKPAESIDKKDVVEVVNQALEYYGAGGKTATGYGSFSVDQKKAQALEEESQRLEKEKAKEEALKKAKSNLSPIAAKFFEASQKGNWEKDKNAFWANNMIEGWLDKLEENHDEQLKQSIMDLFEIHFKGALADPDKTKGKKNKPVYKPRVITVAKRILSLP